MKRLVIISALALTALTAACGGSDAGSDGAAAGEGVPTVQANGGFGTWTATVDGAKFVATIPASSATDPLVAAAEKCRVGLDGKATTWVLLTIDATGSASSADTLGGEVVTGDGAAVELDGAVTAINDFGYSEKTGAAADQCRDTNQTASDNQGLVPAGAKGKALMYAKAPIPSIKTVSFYVLGQSTPFTYVGPAAGATPAATGTAGASASSATATPTPVPDSTVVASAGDATILARKAGCTNVTVSALDASDKKDKATKSISCSLNGKTVQLVTYKNTAATEAVLASGRAIYEAMGETTAYIAVGGNWIASEAGTGSKAAAETLASKIGGRVEVLKPA